MIKTALIITTVAAPNKVLKAIAKDSSQNGVDLIIIGDISSPADFDLEGCDYYDIDSQKKLDLELATIIPEKHYSRKNLGYLQAVCKGAEIIVETDDDNIPLSDFWLQRKVQQNVFVVENQEWVNVYKYFTEHTIWPRGFALEKILDDYPSLNSFSKKEVSCPVQQGLVNGNPDVDAIFRLFHKLPFSFSGSEKLAIGKNSWCPFNSQNTTWFKEVFMLLYLPSYCNFRMTDIWRSFVSLRIMHENDQYLMFHEPTVFQERNEHILMDDFADELPGYQNNLKIVENLKLLDIKPGKDAIPENLVKCYSVLIEMGLVKEKELILLDAWIRDMQKALSNFNK